MIVWRLGGNIIRTTLCWIDDQLISFSALTLLVWSSIGHLACKNRPEMTYYVSSGTLNPTQYTLTEAQDLLHHSLVGSESHLLF